MDDAGRLRGGPALVDLPGAHLLDSSGQEGLQAEDVEADAGELVETGFGQPGVLQHLAGVRLVKVGQVGFELGVRNTAGAGARMRRAWPATPCWRARYRPREHVDERLGGHQMQVVDVVLVDLACGGGMVDGLAGFKDLLGLLDRVHVRLLDLLAAQVLFELRQRVLDGLQVGEDQLSVDGVDVVGRIHLAVDVDDVVVLEGAHDLADRVRLADVGQELVAQAFAFGGALDDAGDVDEGDGRGHDLLGVHQLGEHGKALVRQRNDAVFGSMVANG